MRENVCDTLDRIKAFSPILTARYAVYSGDTHSKPCFTETQRSRFSFHATIFFNQTVTHVTASRVNIKEMITYHYNAHTFTVS